MSFQPRQIRLAETSDAPSINDIYNHYVDESTCTFDTQLYSLADRITWLQSRAPQHPVIVCTAVDTVGDRAGDTVGDRVVGWASISAWHSRPAYARTAEVSFYVHHQWHRQGIGRLMLADLIERARGLGHRVLLSLTCTEQAASTRLQESFGFVKVGHLTKVGYKFERWLDVAFYQLSLDDRTAEIPS